MNEKQHLNHWALSFHAIVDICGSLLETPPLDKVELTVKVPSTAIVRVSDIIHHKVAQLINPL
jgi:hypothetical protein